MDNTELKVVKITHREAEISIREKFSLSKAEREHLYLQLRDVYGIQEALILSTCNRTEVYYVHKHDLGDRIIGLLSFIDLIHHHQYNDFFTTISDSTDTLRHLYGVAIGLDSQVLGDIQIFGQVKQAYQESVDMGFASGLIHRAMHTLFRAHKQVCEKTCFKDGAASVSYNAVKLLKDENLAQKNDAILVVGAGKMGADACRHLVKLGYTNIHVTNRSEEKSTTLSEELNISVLPFEQLFEKLGDYSAIISAIGSAKPVFHLETSSKLTHHLQVVDLCNPRSFSEEFIDNHVSSYFDIDFIGSLTEETLDRRKAETSKVALIIDENLAELSTWVDYQNQTKGIKKFKETLETLRKEAMSEYLRKSDPTQTEMMEDLSRSIIQRIVKLPVLQLKQVCERERVDQLGESLNELFNLEYHENHKQNRL
ncbi:MAG: glutamyl-tRNA reductase [Cyclobacteriaceae bacterium]